MTAPAGTVTFLFTDLVSSTEALTRLGDDAGEALRRTHFRLLRDAVTASGGHEVKNLGDGLMVAFASAVTAIECAIAMQRNVARHNREGGAGPLQVRIGLNVGEPILDEADYFGAAVVIAKRLCDRAEGGQILASDLVRRLVGGRGGFKFAELGRLQLKGLADPVEATAVMWEADESLPRQSRAFFSPGLHLGDRSSFVGRAREVAALTGKLDAVSSGRGGTVLIAGEPGVGKTRLASEVASMGAARGWHVLYGRCYESEGMPPYVPLIEALGELARSGPRDMVEAAMERAGPEIGLLLPTLATPPAALVASTEGERWALFRATTDFLAAAADDAPGKGLILLLDDLHWADRPTLVVLQHLARALPRANVLLLGTYRTVDLDRIHPLSETLAILSRERLYDRILLSTLSEGETAGLIEAVAGMPADPRVVAAVYRETGGNAFFVEEVVVHLLEQGRDITTPATAVEEWGIPEGVKQVIGRRLSRLSEDANRLLQVAAVAGATINLEVVQRVAGLEADPATAALEEALRAGLLREEGGYHFSHALVRETINDELSLARRQRLHGQIGGAIEEVHYAHLAPYYAALAAHYREAGAAAPAEKTLRFAEEAGRAAARVLAWEDAAAHFATALAALDARGVDDRARRFDLLVDLLESKLRLGDPLGTLREYGDEAFRIALALGDPDRLARISAAGPRAIRNFGGPDVGGTPIYKEWTERAERYALAGTVSQVHADVERAFVLLAEDRYGEAFELRRRALDLARRLGDEETVIFAVRYHLMHPWPPGEIGEALQLAREFSATEPAVAGLSHYANILRESASLFLEGGDRSGADRLVERVASVAADYRHGVANMNQLRLDLALATVDGRLSDALARYDELQVLSEQYANPLYNARVGTAPLAYLGRFEDALAAIDYSERLVAEMGGRLSAASGDLARAVLLANMGSDQQARSLLDRSLERIDFSGDARTPTYVLAGILEAGTRLRDAQLVEAVYLRLTPLSRSLGWSAFSAVQPSTASVPRLLGEADVFLGRLDDARRHFEEGVALCDRVRFRPEAAITRTCYAGLLAATGATSATGHALLDTAISEFEAMGMSYWLGRALALRGRRRTAAASYPDGLSEREVDVLRLIAAGRSNQQIADELVISLNTVIRHVSNIFAKIGAANRVEAATYAQRHGFVAAASSE